MAVGMSWQEMGISGDPTHGLTLSKLSKPALMTEVDGRDRFYLAFRRYWDIYFLSFLELWEHLGSAESSGELSM